MVATEGPGQSSPADTGPVAVIGVGCRFAGGATSPAGYWEMLRAGRDGIGLLPERRWQPYADLGGDFAAALRRATRWGGFLPDIEGFDAEFFGLSPREAELMDPQQRLLLEVAWEALEHAGIPPHSLAASDAGVFVGVGSDDYGRRLLEHLPTIEAWTGIGSAMCAVANRISYALDLRGPSLAVDTACSASLVALHLACQSVRTGESPVALAAGVNLVVSPGLTLTLDAAGATAPDGRCKSFDSSADGYGRGEGAGVLVLKRLADARRDGDRVLATILGSAVNQDGRTNGIMAPNAQAQRHVLARACAQAGVDPRSVDYVEAHGTGTRLGDPLEASALSAVYGAGREPGRPCLIGSVKSNIGHLEAGAGVAGVIKAILALGHGEIPPTLHHTTGNPAIDWDDAGLRVVTEPTAWPRTDRPRRAGVSAFGYGGTVAHLVLEEAPQPARSEPAPTGATAAGLLFPLSAASEAALREQAGDLAAWLSDPAAGGTLADVGHTLALRRSHLGRRAAVVAADREELVTRLRHVADGRPGEGTVSGVVPPEPGRGVVWVFSGHGSQWTGMGRELLATEPAFATVVDTLAPVFTREIGFSPRSVLAEGDLVEIDRIQTMIFVLQVGLAAVWNSYGVTPDAVIGHSVGEIAAAVVSGALTLEEGGVLICRRSRLLRRVAGQGAMAMVGLGFDEVTRRLSGRADVVAAIASSPVSTVVAGDPAAVEEVMGRWAAEDVDVRRVASDVAFHSPHMDPLLAELAEAASGLSPASPRILMYSTSMPQPCATPFVDGDYWAANLRSPVRLAAAVLAAAEDGHRTFVEISSHPVVAHSVKETLADPHGDAFVGTSLRRNQPERATLLANAGALYCRGVALDWATLQPAGGLAALPTVAWQRRPLWRDTRPRGAGAGLCHDGDSHTLLGTEVPVGGHGLRLWRTLLDGSCRPYPGSHTINGVEIVPAAVLINTLLRAAADGGAGPVLRDVSLRVPLTDEHREVQVSYADGVLRLASQAQDQDHGTGTERPWLVHTSALVPASPVAPPPSSPPDVLETTAEDPAAVARHLASVGVPTMAFDWTVEELRRGPRGLRARVRAERPGHPAGTWAPMLDAALSVAPVADPVPALRMVAGVREVRIVGEPPETAVIDVVVSDAGPDLVDVSISDGHGAVLATLAGLRYAGMPDVTADSVAPQHLVHGTVWRKLELAEADGQPYRREVVLVAADARAADDWRERLSAAGAPVRVVPDPAALARLVPAPGAWTDVLLLPAVSDDPPAEAATRATWLLASVAQHLAGGPPAQAPRLWCLTTGVRDGRTGAGLALAPLWGLGRVLRSELPQLWGGTLDVRCADDVPADLVLRLFGAAPAEDVVSVRDGGFEVARITAVDGAPTRAPFTCRADGTYLVTGGLGALGLEVAQWLVERGARRLVLTGRRALPPRATWDDPADDGQRTQIGVVRDLEALGVTVHSVALDIGDAERAAALLDTDALGLPPIRGVVHAAGVLDNRMLADVDEESVRTVLRPKAAGAWTLHELFPPGTLDFLVLFSSCGQLLGLPGQSTYGPANVFLDALAAFRQATDGDVTLSLGWTSWRSKGMSVNEVVDLELRARGVGAISVREAFDAWDWAYRHGAGQCTVLRVLPVEPGMDRPVVLAETVADAGAADPAQAGPAEVVDLSGLTPEELRSRLLAEVTERIVAETGLSGEALDPRRSLSEQGLDSVMTIVVRRSLESRFGHVLPATLLWHQPTVTAIADHLTELLTAGGGEREVTPAVS